MMAFNRKFITHAGVLNRIGTLCFLLLLISSALADDFPELSKKDKLVAAYLFNFTKFIEWPDLTERDPRSEIVICLQANSKILGFIRELVAGRNVGIRQLPVRVRAFQYNQRCDMVYVEEKGFFEELAADTSFSPDSLREVPIVTASTDLYRGSAAISFFEQKKRLRFEVNMNKINSLKLDVRSDLLKLARIRPEQVGQ